MQTNHENCKKGKKDYNQGIKKRNIQLSMLGISLTVETQTKKGEKHHRRLLHMENTGLSLSK